MSSRSISTFACLLLLSFAGAVQAQISSFKHVVIVIQENRSTDNMFYALCQPPYGTFASCSTTPTGSQYNIKTSDWLDATSPTGVTQPTPVDLVEPYDLGHLHHSFVQQCDKDASGACRMDGAASVVCDPPDCSGYTHAQYRYVDNSTGSLNPYLDLATQYGFANYMFQTNQGPSYPAHQYLFGATTADTADHDHAGTFISNNGNGPTGNSGCLTPNDGTILVQLIDANGVENPKNRIYPCFDHTTLVDLLEPAGVTWRYYTPGAKSIFTPPTSISHLCQQNRGQCAGPDWVANVDTTSADVLTDIANCNLKQVNWVVPIGDNSDHAQSNKGGGPSWVASIVNAIGNSYTNSGQKCDYWGANVKGDETAIVVLWDDWGGWYDHEAPKILKYPQGGSQLGFRVPALVISAYTPVHFVSNNRFDFGSVIRFVEQNYGIAEGALTFADARAVTDMKTFFKLTQVPRVFVTIASPKDADFFVHDPSPQTDPDDY
ncbi:MAG: hypothetical protein H0X25_13160 [Acidobacteriales bacterium]|nr:hypothetical protein [Terriglobales bacterium]